MPPTGTRSRWAGLTAEERSAQRRASLLDAAYDLLEDGVSAITVRATSRLAKLHTRYFYESFSGVDQLLGALFDRELASIANVALVAFQQISNEDGDREIYRGVSRAILRHLTADSKRPKIVLRDGLDNPVLTARRRRALDAFVMLFFATSAADTDEKRVAAKVTARMVAGAVTELASGWTQGDLGNDLDMVIDQTSEILAAVARVGGLFDRTGERIVGIFNAPSA